ncbi:hypothetical protein B7453_04175 [Pseudomonas sp. IB20]|nr:hypothetical protein B7453_04175 [Pseudomonas sp. IB20]
MGQTLEDHPIFCGQWACCGERACPALGCTAAPIRPPQCVRHIAVAGFRAASPPNAGQARSPQTTYDDAQEYATRGTDWPMRSRNVR